MSEVVEIPAHVPPHLVRDVDIYNIEGGEEEPFIAWSKVQAQMPDIYFSPRYGGFWVLNRARFVPEFAADAERFRYILIPDLNSPLPPLTIEPSRHTYFRKPLAFALGPKNVRLLEAKAREVIIERIERVRQAGECEFMRDIASYVPVSIILAIFDLPFEDRPRLQAYSDAVTHSSDEQEREDAVNGVFKYADEWVRKRKAAPGDDLITTLCNVMIDGKPITHEETTSMVGLLLLGGLDTVTYTMGAIMRFLAEHPAHMRQLVEQPDLIPAALDELLRRHAINGFARKARCDLEIEGVRIKAGDQVFSGGFIYGLDPEKWNNPLEVDFERRPETMTFGAGIHKCVGMNLARHELRALLEEWVARIPVFSIKSREKPKTTIGSSIGTLYLPLQWKVSGN